MIFKKPQELLRSFSGGQNEFLRWFFQNIGAFKEIYQKTKNIAIAFHIFNAGCNKAYEKNLF